MSSILKALKKLEDEKATRGPEALKIDSDILRVEGSQRYSTVSVFATALILFAGGSFATYMYMKKDPTPSDISSNTKTIETKNVIQSFPQKSAPIIPEIKTEKLPVEVEITPAKHSGLSKNYPIKQQKKIPGTQTATGTVHQNTVSTKHEEQDVNLNQPVPAVKAIVKAAPLLRVNGIAYQDGTNDHVAIVNGIPVSGGSIIEGAKVEVIQKNRVRFSYNGELFDVSLGKSNR